MIDSNWFGELDQAFCLRFMQTLLHFLWQGAVVGVLLMLLAKFPASYRVRYWISVASLSIMFACIPVTYFLLPSSSTDISEVDIDQPTRVHSADGIQPDYSTENLPDASETLADVTDFDVPQDANTETLDESSTEDAGSEKSQLLGSLAPFATVVYLFGVAIMLLRVGIGLCSAHRLQRHATPVDEPKLLEVLRTQACRIGLKAVPAIAYCQRIAVPIVVGILRPTILLPSSMASGFTPQQLEAILTHELAHIRRFDLLVNLFQRIVESLLFFHPAVWYVSRQVSAQREHCCDDFVLSSGCQRFEYADALIRMAELCGRTRGSDAGAQLATMAATGRNHSQLRQRVMRVLGEDQQPRLRLTRFGIFTTAVIVCVLAVAPAVVRTLVHAQESSPPPANSSDEGSSNESARSHDEDAAATNQSETIISLAFSPNGNQLVGGTSHKTVQVWDASKGSLLKTLEGHAGPVEGICFSPDGRKLYCVSKKIRIWDVATWRQLSSVEFDAEGDKEEYRFAAWSPDASLIAMFGQHSLQLIESESGKERRSIRLVGSGMTADFSPDGKEIATGTHAAKEDAPAIHIWGVETGELRRSIKSFAHVTALAYAPDGQTLGYSGYGKGWKSDFGGLVLENIKSGKRREFNGFSGSIREIAFSPDGRFVATGGYGPELLKPGSRSSAIHSETKVFALSSGRTVYSSVGEPRRVRAIRISPNSTLIASSDEAIVAVRNLNKRLQSWMRFADSPFRKPNRPRNAIELLKSRDPKSKKEPAEKKSETEKATKAARPSELKVKPPAAKEDFVAENPNELRPFTPEGGRFTFSTAGGREPVNVVYRHGEGDHELKGRLLCFDQPHCRCQVRYVDLPDTAKDLPLLEVLNKYGFAAWAKKGKYKKEKSIKKGKYVGEEYIVVGLPVGPFKLSHVRVQVFVAERRAYFVSASCPDNRKSDAAPEIRAFLDSFCLVESQNKKTAGTASKNSQSNTQFLIDALKAANNIQAKDTDSVESAKSKTQLRQVNIRFVGGKAKEPLRKLTVKANRERGKDSAADGLTDMNGSVTFELPAGVYYLDLQPEKELPYLPIPIGYDAYPGHYRRWIRVKDEEARQDFTFNLADACELTLRAVDADTGKGISGVTFVMDNLVGEYYAEIIDGDNLGAKRISNRKDDSLKTDEAGVFRRFMGPREGWTCYVWDAPAEYEKAPRGQEFEMDTRLGKLRAEYTFKFRRKPVKLKKDNVQPAAKADPKRRAAFDSFKVGRPSSKWSLTIQPNGSYEYVHFDPLAGRHAFTRHADQLSSQDLVELDRHLAETRYLNKATDEITNAFTGYLSVGYRSKSFSVNLSRREGDDSYDEVMEFVDKLAAASKQKIPTIPWQRYSTKRFDEAVAKGQPILQYYFEPAIAHEIHSRDGPASVDTVQLIKEHGVVCLNASPELGAFVFDGRKTDGRPKILTDGLMIYLPKTKQRILLANLDSKSLLAGLRRAFVESDDGRVDVGSRFTVIPDSSHTRISGFDFAIHTNFDWVLPENPGDKRKIPIKLGVANRTDKDALFARAGGFIPVLETPDGKKHVLAGKREGLSADDVMFKAGESAGIYVEAYFEKHDETGEVSFCYDEGPDRTVRFGPIMPGKYLFSFQLLPPPMNANRNPKQTDQLWTGRGTTSPVSIMVHAFSRVVPTGKTN